MQVAVAAVNAFTATTKHVPDAARESERALSAPPLACVQQLTPRRPCEDGCHHHASQQVAASGLEEWFLKKNPPVQVAVAAVNAAVSMRKLEAPEVLKTYIVMDDGRTGVVRRPSPRPKTLRPKPANHKP